MADGRPFIPAALDDLGLDVYTFRVFCRIVRRAGDGGTCFESIPKIAATLRLWRPTVTRAVQELRRLGLIRVEERPGQTGIITILPPTEWQKADQGGKHTRYAHRPGTRAGNRPGVGRKTAPVPGRKTAHKGTPLKVLPEGNGGAGLPPWPAIARELSGMMPPHLAATWVRGLEGTVVDGVLVVVAPPGPDHLPWLNRNRDRIEAAAAAANVGVRTVRFERAPEAHS